MTDARQRSGYGLPLLLAVALTGCSEQVEPTAWIPRGTINGVITTTGVLPASPRRLPLPLARFTAGGRSLSLAAPPPPPRPAALALPLRWAGATRRGAARSRPAFAPHDLLVTFRAGALGAPPVGSAVLATARAVQTFGRAIRSRLAALLPPGAAVTGVSPAL